MTYRYSAKITISTRTASRVPSQPRSKGDRRQSQTGVRTPLLPCFFGMKESCSNGWLSSAIYQLKLLLLKR